MINLSHSPFFFLSKATLCRVILSEARDSARSEGPALLLASTKQVLRPFGAQDDKRARFAERKKRGRETPAIIDH